MGMSWSSMKTAMGGKVDDDSVRTSSAAENATEDTTDTKMKTPMGGNMDDDSVRMSSAAENATEDKTDTKLKTPTGGKEDDDSVTMSSAAENATEDTKMKAPMEGEEDDDVVSDMKLISLVDSPHLDANVSQALTPRGVVEVKPKFTRSWSFMEAAQKRKVTLSTVNRRSSNLKGPNLKSSNLKCSELTSSSFKIEAVNAALARSWSFTRTARSPRPEDGPNSNFRDFITIDDETETEELDDCRGAAQEQEAEEEEPKQDSPMPSIHEDKEATAEDVPTAGPVKEFKVKPLLRTVVYPSEPTSKHWLRLSNLDRVVNPTFSSVIHYYSGVVTETQSFTDVTRVLRETLAKTLVAFYPLAGRLELGKEGKVDLNCNDAGAVWIEAAVNSDLKDVGGAQTNHLLSGFDTARVGPGPIYVPDQITPMPVLIIQTTKFTCGTIAIATSWHHTIADGFSGTHFMRSWAEVALGKPISVKPLHSREILNARDPPNPTLVNGYSTKSLAELAPEQAKVSTSEPAQLEKFDLNKEAIAQLKLRANLEPPPFTPRPYTSAESISAHLWRQMTKARAAANSYEASMAKEQLTKFFMFVDGRKRLRLPPGYFGNVVCSACAIANEADILNKPLHYSASLIRIATRNITEEYFRSLIDWVELQGMASSKSEHVNSLGHDVAATFWTFFPLYEIEFGWGKPIFAARNSPPRPLIDGIAMMPSAEGKGMVALLNLHSDRMSKLQRQISFATVFQS